MKEFLEYKMHDHLKPKNANEEAIEDAIHLLLSDRESFRMTEENLCAIFRAAPEFSLTLITQFRTSLLDDFGVGSEKIGSIVRKIEWEIRDVADYINEHSIGGFYEKNFILKRLEEYPSEFKRSDLKNLLTHFRRPNDPVREKALDLLSKELTSFAEQLTSGPLGISEDVDSLKASIDSYGFNLILNETLAKIDQELSQESDPFDQKATICHIRSFFEKLHESVGKELQSKKPNTVDNTPLGSFGQAVDYLQRKEVITKEFMVLGKSLYSILSDDKYGVHALKADRDYSRLCRNMVVEYAITIFLELERRLSQPGDD